MQNVTVAVRDWGQALMTSLTNALALFFAAIPRVIAFALSLIALVVAFDALGLPAVSDVLRRLLLWLPNLAVALVILVIGGLVAGALGRLVRGATAEGGFTNPDALAAVARVAVW